MSSRRDGEPGPQVAASPTEHRGIESGRIFAVATSGKIDFDSLCDRVLANVPKHSMPGPGF